MQYIWNTSSMYNHSLVDGITSGGPIGNYMLSYKFPIQKLEVQEKQMTDDQQVKENIQNELQQNIMEQEIVKGGKLKLKKNNFRFNTTTSKAIRNRQPRKGKFT